MTLRLFTLLFSLSTLCQAEIVVPDHAGQTLRLAKPAVRIVSLAPHITENLFAIGAGGRIVATVDFSDYPPAAQKIPRLGNHTRIDLEALLTYQPDLVIAWKDGNPPALIDQLRALGLPIYVSQSVHIESLADELERYGQLTGQPGAGDDAAHRFRQRLADLNSRYAKKPTVRVFYEIWNRPLMTVGGTQVISEVIRLCGGENIFGHLRTLVPTVSIESVLAAKPEAIVTADPSDSQPQWLNAWKQWPQLPAVARGNLFHIHPDLMQRHTPRLLEGAEQLCTQLDEARRRTHE